MAEDVVVVGAGPTGLMLACELSLAGVRPVVLERRPEPSDLPRANGLVGQVVEVLDRRGLLERFRAGSPFAGAMPGFPFGSVPLRFAALDPNPVTSVLIQQPRIERLLTDRAVELGVEIRRGQEVRGLAQDDDGVTLDVAGPGGGHRVRARYAVGCDGGRGPVRGFAGIGFPGTTDREVLRMGHFTSADTTVEVPGHGLLRPGWNRLPLGRVLVTSLRPGIWIVGVREDGDSADTGPLPLEELRRSLRRVLGVDLPLGEPIWLSRTVGQARLAETYRAGRVLLAGDAAHLFPAGGSALNVGLLDAVNLGWKLAADVLGTASAGLLDSYQAERRPVGERALLQTRAQAALDRAPGEDGDALRALLTEVFALPQPLRHLAELTQGSDVRYDLPGDPHPLLGRFLPDFRLTTAAGPTRLAELLRAGGHVLLDFTGGCADVAHDGVDVVRAGSDEAPADALLVRPDGHVAWVAGGTGPREALDRWAGHAVPA
ncbi:FAD-dependent monooxygenase [Umezawaea sp. Da 62-37]|uniref:FAD-dependent monooxygenase n=1 Tax=Umezawaea sp. Da 62-37 TaxID=3075927 RepID=UPI0028F7381F|nr:FAD-dependent monooxygenase [Umezawaea sp. Da 62-37]WNV86463.1 FAD-dependent monooxygenase [Umezawaea sp. Da 62-37]